MSKRQAETDGRGARVGSVRRSSALLALAFGCGCFSSHGSSGPSTSTETGNPPVIDAKRVTLEMSAGELHVSGSAGAVRPGSVEVEVKNLATGKVTKAHAAADGSFDVKVDGSASDTFIVTATAGGKISSSAVTKDPSKLSCSERENMAGTQLANAIDSADKSCAVDADCVTTTAAVDCHDACDPVQVFSKLGAALVEAEVARIDREVCGNFSGDGCSFVALPCVPPQQGVPACQNGQCVRADASSSCTMCIDQAIVWGSDNRSKSGLVDRSTLSSCGHYSRVFGTPVSQAVHCERELAVCDANATANVVLNAIANADVQRAIADSPVLYGVDPGELFQIRIGARDINVGFPCAGQTPCVDIPPGVQALHVLLQSIDEAIVDAGGPDCALLQSSWCPSNYKFTTVCTQCGVAGGCGSQVDACAKPCTQNSDCTDTGSAKFCSRQQLCEVGGCL